MKKFFFVLTCLMFVLLILGGCSSKGTSGGTESGTSTIIEEAISKGKLALADANVDKAKSHFNLVLQEDPANKDAEEWLKIVGQYELFVFQVNEKAVDLAGDTLKELKNNEKYGVLEGLLKEHEYNYETLKTETTLLAAKMEELKQLYNPNDESSMPDETYLVRADEILASPYINENQRKAVEKFKKEATERAETILEQEEEKRKAAEAISQQSDNPYAWAPGIKEQFEGEVLSRGYADSIDTIRYEKSSIYNDQGHLEVYAELGGVEYRILRVNVKTGDFTGL
ncbi:hypothetical protein ACQCVP_19200 [Rossellomorea vietnamensis]|uniref:hypothetical protein n=1 Tax=Rossellomorea vietnamensis TaxID=218284 RepID=UPI003CF92032